MTALDTAPEVYVEPFLGAGAVFLRLLSPELVPFVSWMGGKRRLAGDLLQLLGLRAGRPVPAVVADACWWGWVWGVALDPELGPEVSAMLRFWRDREVRDPFDASLPPRRQDPRDLWFALRGYGPLPHPVEGAAQLLWLQARAASGVPVWWEGQEAHGPGFNTGQLARDQARAAAKAGPAQLGLGELVQDRGWKGDTATRAVWPATQGHAAEPALVSTTHGNGQPPGRAYAAGQKGGLVQDRGTPGRRAVFGATQKDASESHATGQRQAPELMASDGRGVPRVGGQRSDRLFSHGGGGDLAYEAGQKGRTGSGGIIDPGTIAQRLDAARARLVKASGGLAKIGRDDATRARRGWRAFSPTDVADRVDAARSRAEHGAITILEADAGAVANAYAPRLGARARVLLDPPYQDKTGYPAECPRLGRARHGGDLGAPWCRRRAVRGGGPRRRARRRLAAGAARRRREAGVGHALQLRPLQRRPRVVSRTSPKMPNER